MRVFRRIMLSSGMDIESLPDTQKLYYKATSKVSPNFSYLDAMVIVNNWNSITGEGVIVCSSNITTISDSLFNQCGSLTNVNIPNSVTSIGYAAFNRCTALQSLTIPNGVTTIDGFAFAYCTSMQYLDFSTHESVVTLSSQGALYDINQYCYIIVPDVLYDEWIASKNWRAYASHIIKKSDWDALQTN